MNAILKIEPKNILSVEHAEQRVKIDAKDKKRFIPARSRKVGNKASVRVRDVSGIFGNPILSAISRTKILDGEEQNKLLIAYRKAEDDLNRILATSAVVHAFVRGILPTLANHSRLSDIFHMEKKAGAGARGGKGGDLGAFYSGLCETYLRAFDACERERGRWIRRDAQEALEKAFLDLNLTIPVRNRLVAEAIAQGVTGDCPKARSAAVILRHATHEASVACNRVENNNLRLVLSIARKMKRQAPTMDIGDLVSEGMTGLRRAIEKFDPGMGNKFSTYAIWWIHQSMSRAIKEKNSLIRVPLHVQDGAPKAENQEIQENRETAKIEFVSLDEPLHDGDDRTIADTIEDDAVPCVETELALTQARSILRKVVYDLPERERVIISARFGLGGEEMDMPRLAARLNLTKERIRQIEKDVMRKLKNCRQIMDLRPVIC
jgi:RNA polymerase sigma factor (sigma-70 family)